MAALVVFLASPLAGAITGALRADGGVVIGAQPPVGSAAISTPGSSVDYVKAEIAKWSKIIRESNIQAE